MTIFEHMTFFAMAATLCSSQVNMRSECFFGSEQHIFDRKYHYEILKCWDLGTWA